MHEEEKSKPIIVGTIYVQGKRITHSNVLVRYFKDANCASLDQVSNHDHNYSSQNYNMWLMSKNIK